MTSIATSATTAPPPDLAALMAAQGEASARWSRLAGLLATLAPSWQEAVTRIWAEAGWRELEQAAGSSGPHHGWAGGLLDHIVEVAEIADSLAALPAYVGRVRRDLVVAGALVHDIGKTVAYVADGDRWAYTPDEALVHHIGVGLERLAVVWAREGAALRSAGVTEGDWLGLRHIIVSHHGQSRYGSMRSPQMLEALIVHLADQTSAEMGKYVYNNPG